MNKIDWPIVFAFVLVGCMFGLSGQRLDNPSTALLFAVFVIAMLGLVCSFAIEIVRRGSKPW